MKKTAMTSKERYMTAFAHREPDRVPVYLDVYPTSFYTDDMRWYNQLEKVEKLLEAGTDPIINIWLPTPVLNSDVKVRTWREKDASGNMILGKEFDTPAGTLRQAVHETDDWCSSTHNYWVQQTLAGGEKQTYGMDVFDDWNISRRSEPWVKGREDLEKLRYILQIPKDWELEEWRHDTQRVMEFAEKHDVLTIVRRTIVSDASFWFCDVPWFIMQLYDDPSFVEEFLGIFEKVAAWQAELALALKPDIFQRRGWYDTPDFWGGAHYNDYIIPSINKEADLAHQAGVLHCYLLTEGWGPYLEKFKELKSDILWGLDPYKNRADMRTVKDGVGRTKTILGGISQEQDLLLGTPETIRKRVRDTISIMAAGGGFVLASSSSIGRNVKWENIKVFVDEALSCGKY